MMQTDAYRLWAAYLNQALTRDEIRRLFSIVRENADIRRELLDDMELDGVIGQLGMNKDEFLASFKTRLLTEERRLALLDSVREKMADEPVSKETVLKPALKTRRGFRKSLVQRYLRETAGENWGFRFVATLAASLALVAGGYWLLNHSGQGNRQQYVPAVGAIASIQSVDGRVEISRGGKTVYAVAGSQVLEQDMVVASSNGRAEVKYGSEETTVKLLSGATARFWLQDDAKRVRLEVGTLVCRIAKQPEGRAMRFITPQAEAMVVGTQLKLAVSNDATHLEVTEGKVKLARNDQQFVMVGEGESADVAKSPNPLADLATRSGNLAKARLPGRG